MAKLPVVARRFACCPFSLSLPMPSYCFCLLHPLLLCSAIRKPNESMRLIVVTIVGVVFGFFIGISFPTVSITKVRTWPIHIWHRCNSFPVSWLDLLLFEILQLHFPSSIVSYIEDKNSGLSAQAILNHAWTAARNARGNGSEPNTNDTLKVGCWAFSEFLYRTRPLFFFLQNFQNVHRPRLYGSIFITVSLRVIPWFLFCEQSSFI